MKYEETKNAYNEILKVVKKYRDICLYDVSKMETQASIHLFAIELKEVHGFNVEPDTINSLDWNRFGDYMTLGLWGEKYRRTISWEDNGKQPEDELLLQLSFSTGAYIFGEDYPTEFFKQFFLELKGYEPKYIDTVNKNLYFSMDNAGKVFNEFPGILKKYYEKNKEDARLRKIKKMEEELEKLKS